MESVEVLMLNIVVIIMDVEKKLLFFVLDWVIKFVV